jgi:hypothetical protein
MTIINDRIKAARYGRCIIEWTTTGESTVKSITQTSNVAIEYNHGNHHFAANGNRRIARNRSTMPVQPLLP